MLVFRDTKSNACNHHPATRPEITPPKNEDKLPTKPSKTYRHVHIHEVEAVGARVRARRLQPRGLELLAGLVMVKFVLLCGLMVALAGPITHLNPQPYPYLHITKPGTHRAPGGVVAQDQGAVARGLREPLQLREGLHRLFVVCYGVELGISQWGAEGKGDSPDRSHAVGLGWNHRRGAMSDLPITQQTTTTHPRT